MKKSVLFAMFLSGIFVAAGNSAQPSARVAGTVSRDGATGTTTDTTNNTGARTVRSATNTEVKTPVVASARSAATPRSALTTNATTSGATSARSAAVPRGTTAATTASSAITSARSAATPVRAATSVARAASTQKVISTGTKVSSATENTVVSAECRQKYEGCMDSFCMLENQTGGRCMCSDKNAEFDSILEQIEKLDRQTYQMATVGVERIEMGASADSVIANANAVADAILAETAEIVEEEQEFKRKSLDLSLWTGSLEDMESDAFAETQVIATDPFAGKEGDALHAAAASLCVAQMPECESELQMLQLMYAQRIKSDCGAYENSLKQQKNASAQKLAVAEQALRDAALEQFRTANKYDLGQCTLQFKQCMITTGGCGSDFSNCATMAAMDRFGVTKSTSVSAGSYAIKGAISTIEIAPSTYDTLYGKKYLCDSVTESCVDVAGQVWDAFLREVAPQLKSAELVAEDKARQGCIGNITSCFKTGCLEDFEEGSENYDLCLTRPEAMLQTCKIPLNACNIDATSLETASESAIWSYVVSRLESMRVNSCATQVRECLTSADVCGSNYSECIGLDANTIVRLCPTERLTACKLEYGEDPNDMYVSLAPMIQGILLGIDNSSITECQKVADEAMVRVCGSTSDCNGMTVDDNLGARSLTYSICKGSDCRATIDQFTDDEISDGNLTPTISGEILWSGVSIGTDGKISIGTIENKAMSQLAAQATSPIRQEVEMLKTTVDSVIAAIESDEKVQLCMVGRSIRNVDGTDIGKRDNELLYPNLTQNMRSIIANSAMQKARANYYAQMDELNDMIAKDTVAIRTKLAEIRGEDELAVRRESARGACLKLAESLAATSTAGESGAGITKYCGDRKTELSNSCTYVSNSAQEVITTTFNEATLVCHKCSAKRQCADRDDEECITYGEETTTCEDIAF